MFAAIALQPSPCARKRASRRREEQKGIGQAIRQERERLGLSQESFAERANVHRTYISSIELGKVSMGIEIAHALACALGMSLMT